MSKNEVKIGVFADAQYSCNDDDREGLHFSKVPDSLASLLTELRAANVDCIVNLGDLVESSSSSSSSSSSADSKQFADESKQFAEQEFTRMLEVIDSSLSASSIPVHHTLGNHCCLRGRAFALERLGLASAHYAVDYGLCRVIVLDSMDQAAAPDVAATATGHEAALAWLRDHEGAKKNAVSWNGAVSPEQLHWLRDQLQLAADHRQHVVVCTHIPVCQWATSARHLLFNHESVLHVLDQGITLLAGVDKTMLLLAGHFHAGGFAVRRGLPHVTVPAVVQHGKCGFIVRISAQSIHLEPVGAEAAANLLPSTGPTSTFPEGPFHVQPEAKAH